LSRREALYRWVPAFLPDPRIYKLTPPSLYRPLAQPMHQVLTARLKSLPVPLLHGLSFRGIRIIHSWTSRCSPRSAITTALWTIEGSLITVLLSCELGVSLACSCTVSTVLLRANIHFASLIPARRNELSLHLSSSPQPFYTTNFLFLNSL
jgi:hypothetical protein